MHLFAEICCQDNYASVRTLNSCFFFQMWLCIFRLLLWKWFGNQVSEQKKSLDRTKSQAMESTQVLAQPVHHRWCNCWGCRQPCCNAVISVQKVTPCRETHSDWTYYSRLCPALISFSPQETQLQGVTFVAPSTRSLVTEQHGTRDHRNLYESCWQAGELVIPESSFNYTEIRLLFYCTYNQ